MINNYILIVDDDPLIREGLTREMEKEFHGKATILNCKNGAVAAELLKCNTIDIIVTDIKMPVMNGIELLQFIKKQRISCKSIVLSSYDDFHLVRDAMRSGAADYLLKPVDLNALKTMLYKLLTEIMMERRSQNSLAFPVYLYGLLEEYLQAPPEKSAEVLAFEEKYRLTPFSPCILGCIKLQTVSSEKIFKLQEAFREDLYYCLNRKHIQYRTILTGEAASCFVFLLFPDTAVSFCLDTLEFYKDKLSASGFQVKISQQHCCLEEIPAAFSECLSYFELSYYDLPCKAETQTYSPEDKNKALQKTVSALSAYDMKMTLYHLSCFFAAVNQLKPPVKDTKKDLNNMIYELLKANPKYIEPLSRSKFTEHDIFYQIEASPSFSVLEKNLRQSFSSLAEAVINTLSDKEDCIIEKAKAYIEANYNDCITLEDIAAHVYLNKSYFSVFFKNKMGLTFRDYLRNYRINRAIQLLTDTNMKIYEVAQAVGYSDSAHFIRAFKQVTGRKPETYVNGKYKIT